MDKYHSELSGCVNLFDFSNYRIILFLIKFILSQTMASRPPSYHEAFNRTKHLSLNTKTLKEAMFTTGASNHNFDNAKWNQTNKGSFRALGTASNENIKLQLDSVRAELRAQQRYIWLVLCISMFSVITLSIVIIMLHGP